MKIFNLDKKNKSYRFVILFIFFLFLFENQHVNAMASISIIPKNAVFQGEPVLIQISGVKLSDIKKITFDNKSLKFFIYKNIPSALLGIDLNKKIGDYKIKLDYKNGSSSEQFLTVKERNKYQVAMEVPENLGGNSSENQTKVINTLSIENNVLSVIKTFAKPLWSKKFIYPILNHTVTDEYGYSRQTGVYTLAHKGVDLKADVGTKVVAMNKGIVRIAKTFQVYGKTIVIDHGEGVMTFYMHLSKIKVNVGELVQQGQLIGISGDTGYVIGPHLHLTVRINNISIDPIKFLELFK